MLLPLYNTTELLLPHQPPALALCQALAPTQLLLGSQTPDALVLGTGPEWP